MENPPQHNNTYRRNNTFHWNAGDTNENYFINIKNPNTKKYFEQCEWTNEQSIEYHYNDHGFRTKNFSNESSYIALGCSVTEGVGVKESQTWPWLLSNKINSKIWNLGVGGSAIQTCYRIIKYYIEHLSIRGVFLLIPPCDRFEMYTENNWRTFTPANCNELYKSWVLSNNPELELEKTLNAIKFVCNSKTIPLYTIRYWEKMWVDQARDIDPKNKRKAHPGPKSQENFANAFYELIQTK